EVDGSVVWRSDPTDTLIRTASITTDEEGRGSFAFTAASAGAYRVVVEGADEADRPAASAVLVWAGGRGNTTWPRVVEHQVLLVADKPKYAAGDVARVLVAAPSPADAALVTVERAGVSSQRVVQPLPANAILEVLIDGQSAPNVYVSVVLLEAATLAEAGPTLMVGYVGLPVAVADQQLSLFVEPNVQQPRPGETVRYTITAADAEGRPVAAELSLALVDEAALAEGAQPGLLQALWGGQPLLVQTAAAAVAAADALKPATPTQPPGAAPLPPAVAAARPRPTAYWAAAVRTDDQGVATVEITMPSTPGSWRLVVKAVSLSTQVGEASVTVLTTGGVVIEPQAPPSLVAGDTLTLRATLYNLTNRPQTARATLEAQGMRILTDAASAVSLPAGGSREVTWQVRVDAVQEATLTFAVSAGGERHALVLSQPVQLPGMAQVVERSGRVTDAATEVLAVPVWARSDRGELTLEVWPSLATALRQALGTLDAFPQDGVDVVAGRLLSRVALGGAEEAQDVGEPLPDLLAPTLQRLYHHQKEDGGWGWWPGGDSDPQITAYVLLALAQAQEPGLPTDASVLSAAASYLKTAMAGPGDDDARALSLYALAAAGEAQLHDSNALFNRRQALSDQGKAFLLLALVRLAQDPSHERVQALAAELAASAVVDAAGVHWRAGARPLDSDVGTTAVVLDALVRVDPKVPLLAEAVRWLMAKRGLDGWPTPWETAWSVVALAEYVAAVGELTVARSYQAMLNGQVIAGSSAPGDRRRVVVPIEGLRPDEENRLELRRGASGDPSAPLYYALRLRYFPPSDEAEAMNSGIAVSREYRVEGDGDAITSARRGQPVRATVTVVVPQDLRFVVVEDVLPAGLEPVRESLKVSDTRAQEQLLADSGARPWVWQGSSPWFDHVEGEGDRVALFASFLPAGVHEFTYELRATADGQFHVLPVRARQQFKASVLGHSDSGTFTVTP
ncbi:MAG: alpha-2-macroglobulin family protein, partial [Dehalococcoidia bacterium]